MLSNLIFFDMEGPLSIHGNAYELMKLLPTGGQIFEVIRQYDGLLAEERRDGYEPGDLLAFIVPFLIHHGISSNDIAKQAQNAAIVAGAQELIASLEDWQVFCITTSYEQYASRIMEWVGIAQENLACTIFPVDRYRSLVKEEDHGMMARIEQEILAIEPGDDEGIKKRLDRFYLQELPHTSLRLALREVKPMGGSRKLAALEQFAQAHGQSLDRVVAVGDSITDVRMLEAVNNAGGLAVAFNADEHSLPHATIGLASTNLGDLAIALDAWQEGGRNAVERVVRQKERLKGKGDTDNFHWLAGRSEIKEPVQIHKRIRRIVREVAGKTD